mmetsp:Transcript_19944/g.44277  ORF Transcript_19944/g.44277 Transcript_19944/m.44277 type:complete len:429 (-) Transcript_19944:93-1379(-)|eukprot:CAMPEP_0204315930 /NCGR_PEP_ID=MMETSP0469-20131031/5115_1 /ASSEMBLY_ACC=CAM_ASM_000384 /TAXON_ID=2969 /ORGANISM="Oxyrrhis marina" /LENGTH=428 /DNA_ID=CAMNT_0051296653 /DNA_START=41 /DNA_END=1327 /DNA_ORIENTATION=+
MTDYPPKGLSSTLAELPEWIKAGCGDNEYICAERGATFPGDPCPALLPDLKEHHNFMAEALKASPGLYDKLKSTKTASGVGLGKCIKTGIDNKSHPMIKTVGLVAGDEECFSTFKDLFDPVISARHGGYPPNATHPTDMNPGNLLPTKIDPDNKYVQTTRCRTGRSVRGFRLPPACTFEERRELERVIVKGLLSLTGPLAGEYFPLHGSRSYGPMPTGMTKEKEEELRSRGNLFQEPDSTLLLSSGCGRHWPDARGIFHNKDMNFFVWINEEDHMRIISMEVGDDVGAIFRRFAAALEGVEKVLRSEGFEFMRNDHLGYILTCPSNLGTGLRAGAMVKVPLISARKDFREICAKLGLQARGTAGVDSASTGGTWDLSNADRLGKSETHLVNIFTHGVSTIIQWEKRLEKGEDVAASIQGAGEWARSKA